MYNSSKVIFNAWVDLIRLFSERHWLLLVCDIMDKFLLNWFIINVQKKKSFDWLFQDKNLYTRTFDDISHLAKSSHPPSDNQKTPAQRPGSKLMKTMPQHQPGLDRIYRGCKPTRPMHLSKYGLERDPISRHGMQLIESHKTEMRGNNN